MKRLQRLFIATSLPLVISAFAIAAPIDQDRAAANREGRILLAQAPAEREGPTLEPAPKKPEPQQPREPAPSRPQPGAGQAPQQPGQVQAPAPSTPSQTTRAPSAPMADPPVVAAPPGAVPQVGGGSAPQPGTVAERAFMRKFGSQAFEQLKSMGAAADVVRAPSPPGVPAEARRNPDAGAGAPNASISFDGAPPRAGARPDPTQPSGTKFFSSTTTQANQFYPRGRSPSQINVPPPVITQSAPPTTRQNSEGIMRNYRSIPGGVVLEGAAAGLGRVNKVLYDVKMNAIMLDDRAAYFLPIPAKSAAVLCWAIDQDAKVGVSLGATHIVYGAVPADTDLALDLKIADHFLGDIVFAQNDWTKGYRFANGYTPQKLQERSGGSVAVFFNFNGFQFAIQDEEVRLTHANFQVQLVPLSDKKSGEGGHLPDFDAITAGRTFKEYQANATHVAENIQYYRGENIVDRMFLYGEVAALIRGLKNAGVNLKEVAQTIEVALGVPSGSLRGAPRPASTKVAISDPETLREIRNRLYELNFDPGTDVTEKAIREFEASSSLPQTGIATEALLERLRNSDKLGPWGVIVYSRGSKKFGMSWAHATRAEAVADAKSACGPDCPIELSFYGNECAVLVHSEKAFAITAKPSLPLALESALADCGKRGKACQMVASVCANGGQRYTAVR